MQQQLLRTTLAIALGLIGLMTVTMLWGHWVGTTSNAQAQVERESDGVATWLHDVAHESAKVTTADLERALPAGHWIEFTPVVPGADLVAGEGPAQGPYSEEYIEGVGTIHLVDATGDLTRNHWLGVVTILAVSFILGCLAVVIARRTSRRLTAPISDLASHAERMASGDLRPAGERYGIAELDRLADSMDASVLRVATLLAEERSLTLDASHQLKTPLTALSLRLEELAEWPDDPEVRAEAAAALEQVERLSGVVDGLLLDRRSPDAKRISVSLAHVIHQQLAEWRPAYTAAHRELTAAVEVDESIEVDPGPVGQVVAALVENSLLHGCGRTTIEARALHDTVWIDVFDQGAGVADDIAAHVFDREVSGAGSTGFGLAAAQDAAVSVGGRIALVRRRPAHFRFFLDRREHPPSIGPETEQGAETHADDVGGDVVSKR
jgi:signal transduction histidine kinase